MRVGMVGLGKLGYPVALAMASQGHEVLGFDIDPDKMDHEEYKEAGGGWPYKPGGDFVYATLAQTCGACEIIFVAVQTPHDPEYEGTTPMLERSLPPKDFDYSYLVEAVKEILKLTVRAETKPIVAIISTVLPGTIRREILPWVKGRLPIVYNPSFIAQGTVIRDFLQPEFVLLGSVNFSPMIKLKQFYHETITNQAPVKTHTLEEAELIKVRYNTFISNKIILANDIMEMCHKLNALGYVAGVDAVMDTLCLARERLISTKYLRGGMGDGGACHPRDNFAMSWLANKLGLSCDLSGMIMDTREKQAVFLAEEMVTISIGKTLPLAILGRSFKPEIDDPTGSAAVLVENILASWSHKVFGWPMVPRKPAVILIGCNKPEYAKEKFPKGSVVVDPWRYIPDQEGVKVVRIGG